MLNPKTLATTAMLLSAAPVCAEGFYVEVWGGFANLSDTDLTGSGGVPNGTASFDTGPAVGGAFGYQYGGDVIRAELEFGYRSGDSSIGGALGGDGDFAATMLMLNGYYAFPTSGSRWTPYLGAGLGYLTEVDLDISGGASPGEYSDRGGLAGQVMAGVDYALNDRLTFNTELRYVSAGSVDLEGPGGRRIAADFESLDLLLGLRLSF